MQNNRVGSFFSEIIFIILFVLVCGSYVTFNSPVYQANYLEGGDPTDEWLYLWLEKVGYSISLDYKYFIFILFAVGLLLFRRTVKRFVGPNAWILYLLFCIYPLAEVRSSIRNSMAMFLLIYAFPCLLSDKWFQIVKYIIIVTLATGFHRVAIIYYTLLLIPLYQHHTSFRFHRIISRVYIFMLLVAFIICLIPSAIDFLQPILIRFTSESDLVREEQAVYFESIGGYGFILFGLYQAIWIALMYDLWKRLKAINDSSFTPFIHALLLSDILLLVMIVAYKFDSNFFRIFMNIVPLNYAGFIVSMKRLKKSIWSVRPIFIVLFIFILIFGIRQTSIFFEYNILTMFRDNWLIQFLV